MYAEQLTSPVTTYAYDGNSNVTGVTDARGHATQYAYDPFNRLVQITAPDPDGGGPLAAPLTTYGYDKTSNLVTQTDPLNHVTSYNYDNLNRVISTVGADPDGAEGVESSVVEYDYHQEGTLQRLIESPGLPVANTYTYDHDNLGRVTTETTTVALDATRTVSATRTYGYDTLGRTQSKIDRDGRLVTYTYDSLDRLTNERWHAGATTTSTLDRNITYTYDPRDNLLDANQGTGHVRTTFAYDVLDRVTDTSQAIPADAGASALALRTTYSYLADDQVESRRALVNGTLNATTSYTYDALSRLTEVKNTTNPSGSGNAGAAFTYLPTGEVESVQSKGANNFVDGPRTTYAYDDMNRVTSIAAAKGTYSYLFTYAYDAASRITREDTPAGAVTYAYYANDQIASADYDYRTDEAFTWDENGNPTGTGYVIGAGNRLLSMPGTTYQYDPEGNRTGQTSGSVVTTYTWDQRNRLAGAVRATAGTTDRLVTVVYDTFNRRAAAYAGDGTTVTRRSRFDWDGDQVRAQLSDSTTTDRFLMGPGIDNVIADEKSGTVNYLVSDLRGSVVEVLNRGGASKTRKDYSAFGEKTDNGNPSVVDTLFAYTGREYDSDLSLQYNRNRWYDPAARRWMSEDPIGFGGGDANLSRYARNDSTNATDPDGFILIAIDGTNSALFRNGWGWQRDWTGPYSFQWTLGPNGSRPAQQTGTGHSQSHARNFWNDYKDGVAYLIDGPSHTCDDQMEAEVKAIFARAVMLLQEEWRKDTSKPIDIVGYSRGGMIAVELARYIQEHGLMDANGIIQHPKVRFLGAYDPVDMVRGFGSDAETVPANVKRAFLGYAQFATDNAVGVHQGLLDARSKHEDYRRSRPCFNRVDGGPENQLATIYESRFYPGTHSALGGAPWQGDTPSGHSLENDMRMAERIDRDMRRAARAAGVSIDEIEDYGYEGITRRANPSK